MVDEWQRQKGESSKSFAYFKTYRALGPARTFEKVINYFKNNKPKYTKPNNSEKNIPAPTLTQLKNQSTKWEWVKRCRAWDNYQDEQERLHNEESFIENNKPFKEKVIAGLKGNFKLQDELLKNSRELSPTTRANSLLQIAKAQEIQYKLFRLSHGRSTEIKDNKLEAELKADVNADIETKVKNVFEVSDEELEEILTIDDNKEEDFTDDL